MSQSDKGRISVIIPAFNEADVIGATLAAAIAGDACEVIVAIGQSSDDTALIAQSYGARVIASGSGRGVQLNAGAQAATGDILLFCHADTLLPRDYDVLVREVLAQGGVVGGAFTLRIDATNRSFRLIEKMVNWRSRWIQLPYGDQALFTSTETFRRIDGFPSTPVMEDFVFVRRLKKLGGVVVAAACVTTSARRWLERGVWRMTLINQLCVLAYYLGVSPMRIARWRN